MWCRLETRGSSLQETSESEIVLVAKTIRLSSLDAVLQLDIQTLSATDPNDSFSSKEASSSYSPKASETKPCVFDDCSSS
jgi:hypothetical protein